MMRLIYVSRSTIPQRDRLLELRAIGISSARQNGLNDLTGMLVFDRDTFAQLLEGDPLAVTETFTRIALDQRHTDVALLEATGGHDERIFPTWRMRVVTPTQQNAMVFKRFAVDGCFRPGLMTTDEITRMMLILAGDGASAADRAEVAPRTVTATLR